MRMKKKREAFTSIIEILVRRKLAASPEKAAEMVRAGKVLVQKTDSQSPPPHRLVFTVVTDPEESFRYNEPVRLKKDIVTFDPARKPANRPAAKSGSARPSCEDENDDLPFQAPVTADSKSISQVDLEELIYRRRNLMEIEERIAVALSRGASVEIGIHVAELVPVRSKGGSLCLKFVVR
jgi:predicted CopG family antitoxin